MTSTRQSLTRRFLAGVLLLALAKAGTAGTTLFSEGFNYAPGLVTNEYAYWHPGAAGIRVNPNWRMTSGSLFESSPGMGWSGIPDGVGPNALSTNGTDSSVFRLNTTRADFGNVAVDFDLVNNGLTTTSRTPAQSYDGVHVWVRYQSEYYLYAVTINRRDNVSVIKKKVAGGPSNGGTYYTLASTAHAVPCKTRQHVRVTVQDNADGSTTIALYDNGALILKAVDNGTIGGKPIRGQGAVGVRGDNCNFNFTNFVVSSLDASAPAAPLSAAITSPLNGQTVSGTFPLRASAPGAATVQWTVDGVKLGNPVASPFTLNWYSVTGVDGAHVLRAVAADSSGRTAASAPVTVNLTGARPAAGASTASGPSVSVTSPAPGQTVSGVFALRASAANASSVQWQIDGANLGAPVAAPFTLNWYSSTGVDGTHTLRAVAADASGRAAASAPVTFTLAGARAGAGSTTAAAPAVSVTSPAAGQTVSGVFALRASASNAVSVQWQVDGANLGAPVGSPFTLNWYSSTGVDGTHTLRAVARDAAGHTTVSAPVTITLAGARA